MLGGFVYQSYDLPYNLPTVGLFIMASDYIKFISDFKKYMSYDLIEMTYNNSKWYGFLKNNDSFGKYPIDRLGDVEIHFLHYKSFDEAKQKWYRRRKRINYNNIMFKFSEMNQCSKQDIKKFQELPIKNKICFITKKYKYLLNDYTYVVCSKKNFTSSYEPFGNNRFFNLNKYIDCLKK